MKRTPIILDPLEKYSAFPRLFWRLQLIGWLLLIPLSVGVCLLVFQKPALILLGGVARPMLGFTITLGLWQFYRRWSPSGFKLTPHIWKITLACLAATVIDVAAIEFIRQALHLPAPPLPIISRGAIVVRLAIYIAWSALYFVIRQEVAAHATNLRLARAMAANREAELRLLRAQVNPHFLFNALNTIICEAEQNPAAVGGTTRAVADYLRYSLSHNSHHAPLGHELNAMDNYLRVEQATHGASRLQWSINATDEARLALTPTALIQPLAENAVKYGLRTSPAPLRLRIEARVEDGEIIVSVENSGKWIERDPTVRKHDSTGIGLANLRRRLELLCGSTARLDISTTHDLVRAEVRLPPLPAAEGG